MEVADSSESLITFRLHGIASHKALIFPLKGFCHMWIKSWADDENDGVRDKGLFFN
jgi:hypothetical protein